MPCSQLTNSSNVPGGDSPEAITRACPRSRGSGSKSHWAVFFHSSGPGSIYRAAPCSTGLVRITSLGLPSPSRSGARASAGLRRGIAPDDFRSEVPGRSSRDVRCRWLMVVAARQPESSDRYPAATCGVLITTNCCTPVGGQLRHQEPIRRPFLLDDPHPQPAGQVVGGAGPGEASGRSIASPPRPRSRDVAGP